MLVVVQRVDSVADKRRDSDIGHVAERQLVVLLREQLILREDMLVRDLELVRDERSRRGNQLDVDSFGDLPRFDEETCSLTEEDLRRGSEGGEFVLVLDVESTSCRNRSTLSKHVDGVEVMDKVRGQKSVPSSSCFRCCP